MDTATTTQSVSIIQPKVEARASSEAGTFDEILDSMTVNSSHVETECPMPAIDFAVLTPLEQELFPILLRLWTHSCLVPFTNRDSNSQMTAERAGQWRRRVTGKARAQRVPHIPPTRGIQPLHRLLDKLIYAQLFRPHVRGEMTPAVDAHAMFDAVIQSRTVEVPHIYMGKGQGQTPRGAHNKKVVSPTKGGKKKKKPGTDEGSDSDSSLTESSVDCVVRGPSDHEGSLYQATTSSSTSSHLPAVMTTAAGHAYVPHAFGLRYSPSDCLEALRAHTETLRYLLTIGAECALDAMEGRRHRRHRRST
jgi:hypothetical protein